MDGLKDSNQGLAGCTVRIKSLPVKMTDGLPGGNLYRLTRSPAGALWLESAREK